MKVAVLGTGRLGTAIAERLQVCGNQVLAWNRTSEKTVSLPPLGVTVTANPVDAIQEAKVVLTVLADADATRRVLLSPVAGPVLAGRTVVQMGTISPEESRGLSTAIQNHGGRYLEAPVLGSLAEARSGTLLVMVGGTADSFERWSPLFHHLSRKPRLVGPVGHAAALKLALNQLIAAEIAAFSLSLGLVQRAGIPVDTFHDHAQGQRPLRPDVREKTASPARPRLRYPQLLDRASSERRGPGPARSPVARPRDRRSRRPPSPPRTDNLIRLWPV